MASGWGITENKGRCYDFWNDFSECMSKCREPKDRFFVREDYLECLHHSKENAAATPVGNLMHHYVPTAAAFAINDNVVPITSLIPFNIRNGDISDISERKSLFVKPTIAQAWHWRPIENLPPGEALKHVGAYVRTYKAALATLPENSYNATIKAKLALILGVSRAVSTYRYSLEVDDFIPDELAPAFLKAVTGEGGTYRFVTTNNAIQAQHESLVEALSINDTERAIISAIHMCSVGLLPVQGYSLIICGHHYLSDRTTLSFKAFATIERQNWSSSTVRTWWQDDADTLRDVLFHKAGHPVNISLKQQLARDPTVVEKLRADGAGSAACRLPAVELELRSASSYKTLLQRVGALFEGSGGHLNFVVLEHAMEAVQFFPVGVTSDPATFNRPITVPSWVVDRPTALNYLRQVVAGHQDTVAFCYGFYCALLDTDQTATGTAVADTLRTSYSLMKLESESTSFYIRGRECYNDYVAYKRKAKADGVGVLPSPPM